MKKSSPSHTLSSTLRSQLILLVLLAAFLVPTGFGQTIEMMKLVVQRVGPGVKEGSRESQPITLYRGGDKYLRSEEPANPAEKVHLLKITREPDAWVINLMDQTAQHIVDPGPTFSARAPIFWLQKPSGDLDIDRELLGLEFGYEELFFRQNKPRDLGTRSIDGKESKASSIKIGAWEVTLFMDASTNKPVKIEAARDGKPEIGYRYISFETDLPFEPALFEPPAGLKISEQSAVPPAAASPSPTPAK